MSCEEGGEGRESSNFVKKIGVEMREETIVNKKKRTDHFKIRRSF